MAKTTKKKIIRARRTPKVTRTDSPTAATAGGDSLPGERLYFGLTNDPQEMPCLFSTRAGAEENAEPDERLFMVSVRLVKEFAKRQRTFMGNPF